MERRLLLVFALTFLIILISQPLLKKYGPKPTETPQQTRNVPANPAPPETAAPQSAALEPPAGTKQAQAESVTVVENDLFKIEFTNRGGQVKSWVLKKYKNDQRQPLELVNTKAADKYGYPLSLWSYDESLRNQMNSALYVASATGTLAAPAHLTFEYSDRDVSVRKTFHFDDSYVVGIETAVLHKGSVVSAFPMWPAGFGDETGATSYAASRVEYQNNESTERTMLFFPKQIERLAIKNVVGGATIRGPLNWAGVTDQYFAAIFLPEDPHDATLVTLRNPLESQGFKRP